MKILFYCLTFYPETSGYANAFYNLIRAVNKYSPELNIDLVTPTPLGDKEELKLPGLNIIRLDSFSNLKKIGFFINSYMNAKKFNDLYKKGSYELVFVETFEDYVFLSNLKNEIYRKLVVRVHSTFETEYMIYFPNFKYKIGKYLLKEKVFNRMKFIASTNAFHNEFVKKHYLMNNLYDISQKDFFVLPNTMPALPDNEKQPINREGKLKFFVLGRMDEGGYLQKGFSDLLNAFILINEKSFSDKIEVTIVGKGPYKERLIHKAKINQLDYLNFIDGLPHDEILEKLRLSDVVILPSRYEGLSMFALEAIATGNVVLFSRTGGLIELVEGNGFLFEPQNIEDLAQKIGLILNLPEEQISQMKERSVALFTERFSENVTAKRFNKLFNIVKASN